MLMKQYAATSFIGLEDVANGPRRDVIIGVSMGNFDRPVLELRSGDRFSANKTNVRALVKAYGDDSDGWINKVIELYAGETTYNGEKQNSVLVRPSPRDPTGGETVF
jgi:hypothetical protein